MKSGKENRMEGRKEYWKEDRKICEGRKPPL
jgi:hypothetical protein